MLKDHDSSAIVAVADLARAREFYEGVLGLEPIGEGAEEDVLTYRTGRTRLVVYRSDHAGKNRTPGKRALLKAIEDLGGKWRAEPPLHRPDSLHPRACARVGGEAHHRTALRGWDHGALSP